MFSSPFKCFGIAIIFAMSPLSATVLYSTGGGAPPSFDNQSVNAWDILPSGVQAVAVEFNPSVTSTLGQIELPLDDVSGSGSVVVELLSNTGGIPGSVIESWTPTLGSTGAMITVSSVLHPMLAHGTNYWIAVTTTGTREANWFINTSNLRGADLFIGAWDSNSGATTPAIAVVSFSATVPEPSSGLLAFAGLLAALLVAAFRRMVNHLI